ncbi:hypothetical protein FANTH_2732 [Fusarium anthophilum]|uniref:F-box domain-containing protein n=1 Tax=Fusarium anthophilum TaxID=48485 RepID=A0A8H4ZSX9_9HYPO|nr:hypothetical protein FANTH_2732 [Fusarium anthophilum]
METEQQEEHAAAVENSPATPASWSALEKMPTEIILMILSEFHFHDDISTVTLVSKRLRSVLFTRLFKTLTFHGSLKKLAHDMKSFLSGEFKNLMMAILSTLKSVTIRFKPYSCAEEHNDAHLLKHRIAVISEFISKISSIDLISFDNRIKDEIDFTEGLVNQPKWNGPKAVTFCGRRNRLIFNALINQFTPNTVKAVRLPLQTTKKHYLALKSAFPLLKGLKADLSSFKSRSRTLICMSSEILQRIDHEFPYLQALIFDQLDVHTFKASGKHVFKKLHLPNLNERIEKLITQLKSMPQLRRFAFTLQESWLCAEYDCRSFYKRSSSSSDAAETSPESDKWPYWLPADAEQQWWSELITRIL